MKRHVLLVNGGKDDPVRLLLDHASIDISLITEKRFADLYTPLIADVWTVDSIGALDQIRDAAHEVIAAKGGVDAVVAPTEHAVPAGGYLRSHLGLPGIPFDVANAFSNKYAMKQRLSAAGIPVARHRFAATFEAIPAAAAAIGLPAVAKPAFGSGAVATVVLPADEDVASYDPLHRALGQAKPPFLVEELVTVTDEYHVDGFVRNGQTVFAAVSRYFEPLLAMMGGFLGSHTVPLDTPTARSLKELHDTAVACLGLRDGVTHLEAFSTPDGLLVGEIACRPGGGGIPAMLQDRHGMDTFDFFLRTELGEDVGFEAVGAREETAWVQLPIRPGRIKRISGPDDFADIPEVARVMMHLGPGDIVAGKQYSTTSAGVLLLHFQRPEDLPELLARVGRRYEIEIVP